jgi:hypothetical protein
VRNHRGVLRGQANAVGVAVVLRHPSLNERGGGAPECIAAWSSCPWLLRGGNYSCDVSEKRGFYEKVTDVNSSSLVFPSLGFLFFVSVATHVVLHHVSIRTLYEPEALCRLGFSRRSRCCQF